MIFCPSHIQIDPLSVPLLRTGKDEDDTVGSELWLAFIDRTMLVQSAF